MKLGLSCIDTAFSKQPAIDLALVKEAEQLGFDSVWTAEAYGIDAVTTATWIAAHTRTIKVGTSIMQMPARSPAMAAMTAMGLDALSQGRFIMGLGSSGPRVAEGWHSVSYEKPLTRTREYIDIVRKILQHQAPVEHQGYHYQLPMSGGNTTGLGKTLKSVARGNPDLPIYLASISPGGIRCAAELADGVLLSFMKPENAGDIVGKYLAEGFAKEGAHCQRENFTVSTMVTVIVTDDIDSAYALMKDQLARQLGGMGAKSKNFYAEFASRMGYADAVEKIQTLFLAGKRKQAIAAVPTALIDDLHLIGPAEKISERLQSWKAAEQRGELDMMLVMAKQSEALQLLAREFL